MKTALSNVLKILNVFKFVKSNRSLSVLSSPGATVSDRNVLLILAGPCGSGKSTLLRAAFRDGLQLFGSEFDECLRSSCQGETFREYNAYEKAWRRKSIFQAHHVSLLEQEASLPQSVLLHVDLYQVLRGIGPSYWPRSLQRRERLREWLGAERARKEGSSVKLGKRSFASLQEPAENDQMMCAYLQQPFFKRFKSIVVNTVQCDYSTNSLQLSGRKAKGRRKPHMLRRRHKYFQAPDEIAQSIHRELYSSWRRNLAILDPAAVFTTQVSQSGDLLLNGSLLARGWCQRF